MKKSLVALATLAAATGAFAQSNVTLYGALDAAYVNATNIDATGTKSVNAVTGGTLVSPVFGLRGSEDLGGGSSAVFAAEGDIEMTNGTTNSNGLFRRKAYAGLGSASLGTLKLGVEINPLIDLNGQLMPLGGNAVSTVTSTAFGYADFFTKNAITWNSANYAGLEATLQRGQSNTIGDNSSGSITAYGLKYGNGPLKVIAAGQDRKAAQSGQASSANTTASTKKANIVGISYTLDKWTLAAASINSTIGTSGKVGGMDAQASQIYINAGSYKGTQLGVGYQATAELLVGASRTSASGAGNLTNFQVRYDLSKRTTVYALAATADNGKGSTGGILFAPIAPSTSQTTLSMSSIGSSGNLGFQGVPGVKSNALGTGIIHRF